MRGYFGIGIYHPKTKVNIGTLWRSAYIYGASFIFTIGKRYKVQGSDTMKSYRHIPLFNYLSFSDFIKALPYDSRLACIELDDRAVPLSDYAHPQRVVYLLGAEDNGLPETVLKGRDIIQIPSAKHFCLNVSTAGSIVMYDRFIKQ